MDIKMIDNTTFSNSTFNSSLDIILPTLTHTATVTVMILFGSAIVFINGLILSAFIADKKLQQRTANRIICSQTCTDLYTGMIFIPDYIIEVFYLKSSILIGYVIAYMMYLSLFNLMALSTDRFLAISYPIFHRRVIDIQRISRIITVIWITPLCLTLIPLFWHFSKGNEYLKKSHQRNYTLFGVTLMLVLVIIMAVLYIFITLKARKTIRNRRESLKAKSRKADLQRKELRVVHLFGLLLVFFIAAYMPVIYINACMAILNATNRRTCAPWTSNVTIYLFMINSITNPVSCMLLKKDYFNTIKRVLGIKKRQEGEGRFGHESPTLTSVVVRDNSSHYNRSPRDVLMADQMSLKKTVLKNNMLSPKERAKNANEFSMALL